MRSYPCNQTRPLLIVWMHVYTLRPQCVITFITCPVHLLPSAFWLNIHATSMPHAINQGSNAGKRSHNALISHGSMSKTHVPQSSAPTALLGVCLAVSLDFCFVKGECLRVGFTASAIYAAAQTQQLHVLELQACYRCMLCTICSSSAPVASDAAEVAHHLHTQVSE